MSNSIPSLLHGPVRVVNVGLAGFARDLAANGAAVVQVDWTPPAGGDPRLLAALAKLGSSVDEANRVAMQKILAAEPVLADVRRAAVTRRPQHQTG